MAWYLLDPGEEEPPCSACRSVQSLGPFKQCLVPRAREADGACTNCAFMGRAATCAHRLRTHRLSRAPYALLTWREKAGLSRTHNCAALASTL